jgi:hypothetical protein
VEGNQIGAAVDDGDIHAPTLFGGKFFTRSNHALGYIEGDQWAAVGGRCGLASEQAKSEGACDEYFAKHDFLQFGVYGVKPSWPSRAND